MNLNIVNWSTHINLLRQDFDIISQFRGMLLLCRKRASTFLQSRELEGIDISPATLNRFNEVCSLLVEFLWDWWHRVCRGVAEGVEVGREGGVRSRECNIGVLRGRRFVGGTLVDATAGILALSIL